MSRPDLSFVLDHDPKYKMFDMIQMPPQVGKKWCKIVQIHENIKIKSGETVRLYVLDNNWATGWSPKLKQWIWLDGRSK